MRTFHSGGVANANDDITQGLPRVEELFEARCPKHPAVLAKIAGEITRLEELEDHSWAIEISNEKESIVHKCGISQTVRAWIKVGEQVRAGAKLTEGNVDPKELLSIAGVQAVQNYILKEVKKVYAVTGIDISDKHVEVIIKQMLKKVIIIDPGDSELCAGQTISLKRLTDLNNELLINGKVPAKFGPLLLGISKSSVETDSFLSAASFQETTKVLTDAAVNGKVDSLFGIKENVIIGKLIPAGTGSKFDRDTTRMIEERAEELDEIREEKLLAAQEEAQLPSEMLGDADDDDDFKDDEIIKEEEVIEEEAELETEE
jgi:DNA-directed RNA polymerase subunit beta'